MTDPHPRPDSASGGAEPSLPADLEVGRGDRVVAGRRGGRRAGPLRSGTTSPTRPRRDPGRRDRRAGLRPRAPASSEDLDLLGWLGVDAYRFSISWPRVLPDGTAGTVSAAGLGFYDRLVDGLLARGIRPAATLYHWDLPSRARRRPAGWPLRDTAERFADYTSVVAERLGDRVDRWATLNEPWCAAFLGYAAGVHAPGLRDPAASLAAAYHLMLGHGLAVQRLRSAGARQVGLVLNLIPVRAEDAAAAAAARHVDGLQNRSSSTCWRAGACRPTCGRRLRPVTDWSFVRDADGARSRRSGRLAGRELLHGACASRSAAVDVDAVGQDTAAFPAAPPLRFVPRPPFTEMGWEVEPSGLGDGPADGGRRAARACRCGSPRTAPPRADVVDGDGVHDPARVDYFRRHVAELLRVRGDRASTYAATTPGRCWTTSSGRRAGPSGSASSGSSPARCARMPKDSALWWRDRLAARAARD